MYEKRKYKRWRKNYELFEVYDNRGFARMLLREGLVLEASCAAWKGQIIKDKQKVLSKLMQISPIAFIDVYKQLSHSSSWFATATEILIKKKQKLSVKESLTKIEKELVEL